MFICELASIEHAASGGALIFRKGVWRLDWLLLWLDYHEIGVYHIGIDGPFRQSTSNIKLLSLVCLLAHV